jgi:hypothetical protein
MIIMRRHKSVSFGEQSSILCFRLCPAVPGPVPEPAFCGTPGIIVPRFFRCFLFDFSAATISGMTFA